MNSNLLAEPCEQRMQRVFSETTGKLNAAPQERGYTARGQEGSSQNANAVQQLHSGMTPLDLGQNEGKN